jgi:integrase
LLLKILEFFPIFDIFVCKLYANFLVMLVTSNICLDRRRVLKDGRYPVKLRVTFLQKQKYYPTGINLTETEFRMVMAKNPRGRIYDYRTRLDQKLISLREHIEKMHQFSFTQLDRLMKGASKSALNIIPFFDEVIMTCEEAGRVRTASLYDLAKKSFQQFRSVIGFYDITPEWLKDYENWMHSRGLSPTTVGIYLRNLRAIYNKAIAEGIVLDTSLYPFRKNLYKIPTGRNIKKALTKEDVLKIAHFSDFKSIAEKKYRDMWLFSYLCNGMNPNDICRLRWRDIDGDLIRFYRHKTKNTSVDNLPITVYLRNESKEIIQKWGNPGASFLFGIINESMTEKEKVVAIMQYCKMVNKYIKRIAVRIGIKKKITNYTARHTFSQVMKNSGQSIEYISESLGHTTILTTRSYLSSFKDEIVENASRHLL